VAAQNSRENSGEMLRITRAASARANEARCEGVSGNPDLITLVACFVSPEELRITLPRLNRTWRDTAAAVQRRSEQEQEEDAPAEERRRQRQRFPHLPLWYVQRSWDAEGSEPFRIKAACAAAYNGQLELLEWMHGAGFDWSVDSCRAAARGGRLPALQWLRQRAGAPWDASTANAAAGNGNLDMLKWLRAQQPPCPWSPFLVCLDAAKHGHLPMLEWACQQDPAGFDWTREHEWLCTYAAMNGHLGVLRWLRAQDPPCPWDADVTRCAAANGHVAVLKWARAQAPPCPWSRAGCLVLARRNGYTEMVEFICGSGDNGGVGGGGAAAGS